MRLFNVSYLDSGARKNTTLTVRNARGVIVNSMIWSLFNCTPMHRRKGPCPSIMAAWNGLWAHDDRAVWRLHPFIRS